MARDETGNSWLCDDIYDVMGFYKKRDYERIHTLFRAFL